MGKKRRHSGRNPGPARQTDPASQALESTWQAIASGDILLAEICVSGLVTVSTPVNAADDVSEELFDALLDITMAEQWGPVAAAFMRLLVALGSRAVKKEALAALAELTAEGVYPPEWVTDIGKPAPGQAWRSADVYGDRETIVVEFGYPGQAKHALVADLDYAEAPTVVELALTDDAAGLLKTLSDSLGSLQRLEEITLTEAHARIGEPLTRVGTIGAVNRLDGDALLYLPLARSRVRRLSAAGTGARPAYTAADRAAEVEEFLRSPQAADAGDLAVARFWAEVLTGYSSRHFSEKPARVGPLTLIAMLPEHAALTYSLTVAQRAGQAAAVTAWIQWAAARQGLDDAATRHLMTSLDGLLDQFGDAYDSAKDVASRAYVRDVAVSDVDVEWLSDLRVRRALAAPFPWTRDPEVADVDATSAEGRATLTAHEFVSCVPAGEEGEAFTAAANHVVEELWTGEPREAWQAAERQLAGGDDRHDVLHALINRRLGR